MFIYFSIVGSRYNIMAVNCPHLSVTRLENGSLLSNQMLFSPRFHLQFCILLESLPYLIWVHLAQLFYLQC